MRSRTQSRILALLLVLSSVACHKHGTAPLALEECDPAGYIGCIQQNAFLSIPITDTNLFLTYSSRWMIRQAEQGSWDAQPLGLGGWSINLVQRYDRANRILISGRIAVVISRLTRFWAKWFRFRHPPRGNAAYSKSARHRQLLTFTSRGGVSKTALS